MRMTTCIQSQGSNIASAVLCLSGIAWAGNAATQHPPQTASATAAQTLDWSERSIRVVTQYAPGFGFDVSLRRIMPERSRLLAALMMRSKVTTVHRADNRMEWRWISVAAKP